MAATLLKPTVRLNFHPAQLAVHESTARFRVVACGRRWGKTTLAVGESLSWAGSAPGSLVWWVAPTYDLTKEGLRMALESLPHDLRQIRRSDRELLLWNGSRFKFRTADNPDNLRAEGVDFLVVDEAAFIKEEAWTAALRPTLADTLGHALLIGTFRGENWFYEAHERGLDPDYPEWESWRYATSANPFIDPAEINQARKTTPADVFGQEWLANPLVYVGAVFPGEKVQEAAERGAQRISELEGECYAGLDWGYTNPTALEVCQENTASGSVRWIVERLWHAAPLEERVSKIVEVCTKHNILEVYADAAGADENRMLADRLEEAGLDTVVVKVPFGKFKDGGIKTRRWYLEQGLEDITPECPELTRTTKRYRYKENSQEDVVKEDDHPVDAATAFYASRRSALVGGS